jgi:hypothetical protein
MSRWAEMFAALSEGHDTVDTVDTVGEVTDAIPTVSQSVNSVKTPETVEGPDPGQLNPGPLTAAEQPLVERAKHRRGGGRGTSFVKVVYFVTP